MVDFLLNEYLAFNYLQKLRVQIIIIIILLPWYHYQIIDLAISLLCYYIFVVSVCFSVGSMQHNVIPRGLHVSNVSLTCCQQSCTVWAVFCIFTTHFIYTTDCSVLLCSYGCFKILYWSHILETGWGMKY